jgi:hypothetical protein
MLVTTPRSASSFRIWMRNSPVAPGISNWAAETFPVANRIPSSAMDPFLPWVRAAANATATVGVAHGIRRCHRHLRRQTFPLFPNP